MLYGLGRTRSTAASHAVRGHSQIKKTRYAVLPSPKDAVRGLHPVQKTRYAVFHLARERGTRSATRYAAKALPGIALGWHPGWLACGLAGCLGLVGFAWVTGGLAVWLVNQAGWLFGTRCAGIHT